MGDNKMSTAFQEEFIGELEVIDTNQPSPVVQDDEAVITTLSRLNTRDAEIRRVKAQQAMMIERVNHWAKQQIDGVESQKQWLLTPLQSFMESINKSNPKIKSLKFPTGKIGIRATPQKIEIDDDFNPAEHQDDPNVVIKTSYAVSKTTVAKQLKDTGELPDYASIVPGEIKFYYKGE